MGQPRRNGQNHTGNVKPQLVLIEWLDSFGCSSRWQEIAECSPEPLHCKSVGWLIYDGNDCKVVVPHISDSDHENAKMQGCGDMTIPAKAIVYMEKLRASTRKSRGRG